MPKPTASGRMTGIEHARVAQKRLHDAEEADPNSQLALVYTLQALAHAQLAQVSQAATVNMMGYASAGAERWRSAFGD